MTALLDSLKDIGRKQLSRYYSKVFNHDFQVHDAHTLIKLYPVSKEEAREYMQEFEDNLPGRVYRKSFLDKDYFFEDPNRHQFYRFQTKLGDKVADIHFRSSTRDEFKDTILSNLHESFLIRESTKAAYLDSLLTGRFGEALDRICGDYKLLESREPEFIYMKLGSRKRYIKEKSSIILDTLRLMESQGFKPEDILGLLESQRVFPLIRTNSDLILRKLGEALY